MFLGEINFLVFDTACTDMSYYVFKRVVCSPHILLLTTVNYYANNK